MYTNVHTSPQHKVFCKRSSEESWVIIRRMTVYDRVFLLSLAEWPKRMKKLDSHFCRKTGVRLWISDARGEC